MRFGNMITTCVRHKISMSWLFAVQLILAVALSLSLVCSLSVCPLGFDTIEWRESWMCFGYEVLLLFDDCLISPIFSIFVLFVRLCFALLSRCFSFLFLFFSCFFFSFGCGECERPFKNCVVVHWLANCREFVENSRPNWQQLWFMIVNQFILIDF